jgi:hypothetical protein
LRDIVGNAVGADLFWGEIVRDDDRDSWQAEVPGRFVTAVADDDGVRAIDDDWLQESERADACRECGDVVAGACVVLVGRDLVEW